MLVHSDAWLDIHQGDCREVMAGMEPESVHCVVTSPPYWGLRDYGVSGQLGLEATPEEYVANMVDVFREVRRVLRADGTVWLNLGDSYASPAPGRTADPHAKSTLNSVNENVRQARAGTRDKSRLPGLKPKDLVGIPWRVAFALQADGWYLRSDIIWAKPNPMPESVTDRPTKAHEYVFLLSKSARYYFDAEAVREAVSPATHMRVSQNVAAQLGSARANGGSKTNGNMKAVIRAPKTTEPGQGIKNNQSFADATALPVSDRNIRSVWTVATMPYPGAHFATFPEKLIEPPIKAGCPEGGVVLDPFGGSGTVARVANRLSRRAVLIDLNGDYIRQQFDRNRELPLGLVDGDAA